MVIEFKDIISLISVLVWPVVVVGVLMAFREQVKVFAGRVAKEATKVTSPLVSVEIPPPSVPAQDIIKVAANEHISAEKKVEELNDLATTAFAELAAEAFDSWMKDPLKKIVDQSLNSMIGFRPTFGSTDTDQLLRWIASSGITFGKDDWKSLIYAPTDYESFKKTAEILCKRMGYRTWPPPSKGEFERALSMRNASIHLANGDLPVSEQSPSS
jgi:hypothetical protein